MKNDHITDNELQALIEELDAAAGRVTQYTNSPLDGLLNAAARKLEEFAALRAENESLRRTVHTLRNL